MPLLDTYRLHISGATFNDVAGHLNEYHVTGNLVQPQGENGINILQRNICGDAFYNSEQQFSPPQCHLNTRIAIQNTIQAWADEDSAAPSVMWLYGPAGAGKSAIAQTMAERWAEEEQLSATFFFARWRAGGSSSKGLFPAIAYQLALHIPQLREPIGRAVEGDPAICDRSLEEQARLLIANPMARHVDVETHKPYLVIIDGLDECDRKPAQSRIVKIIFQLFVNNKLPIRFLICSRPEPHIRETFESIRHEAEFRCLVLDETFHPSRDILRRLVTSLRYLRDRLAEIQARRFPDQFGTSPAWPSDEDLMRLVQNASGQFVYAATVIKFDDDEYSHPVEQLRLVLNLSSTQMDPSPFADLDALYTFILSANPNVPLLVRILGAFFAIPDPENTMTHCGSFLDNMLGLERGSVRFALRGLHSILVIPDSDTDRIRVHHASLHDFFSHSERAGIFYLASDLHHMELGKRCLSIVLHSVKEPHPSNALLTYTHLDWTTHYIPVSDQHSLIQACLQAFRDTLEPQELSLLCRDANAMTLRFVRIIDFLKTLANATFDSPSLTEDYEKTWFTLLLTLFNPNDHVLQFFQAWSTKDVFGGCLLILTSLGIVFQRLWSMDITDLDRAALVSEVRFQYLSRDERDSPEVVQRNGGNHPAPSNVPVRWISSMIKPNLTWEFDRNAELKARKIYYSPLSRTGTHWSFAGQWCAHLVQAPPAPELLGMLTVLIKNELVVHKEEIDHDALNNWLMFGPSTAREIAEAFQRIRDPASNYKKNNCRVG
ncbi:hypothetical protein DFH07DRAFT_784112 [Mycena maculata]|uniref:NACHT domain-containing protein n=1 Tax=Mycena maculata TaxID=230809 RepID=A0AAD7HIC1_9AGAR|nr:hypothetical protein DFH07DRAFT_784112 [Mycena maculata]